ncbi:MAG: YihA family ribosome biogenesis GTP-binding protein [Chlorobiota bacterium]|jgi:GTP-binding protein|nr:YihA family ribosome biogenesis GTP-binding protein [Chlorobiota bacterium]QQS65969.1 MAG: YihA family ribosome biogenesis GTP-binding protein [Chlorobiota bacterium]
MLIKSTDFILSAAKPSQFPNTPLPEIAFSGRSNVGKSTLLNLLTNRKSLAKTSGTPGKTQQINFFRINNNLHFVDLPGYGYAKVSKTDREDWKKLIESYFNSREQLRIVMALSDIRHKTPTIDSELFLWLDSMDIPFVIVLTKSDKLSKNAIENKLQEVLTESQKYINCKGVIPCSSVTRDNREKIMKVIDEALK